MQKQNVLQSVIRLATITLFFSACEPKVKTGVDRIDFDKLEFPELVQTLTECTCASSSTIVKGTTSQIRRNYYIAHKKKTLDQISNANGASTGENDIEDIPDGKAFLALLNKILKADNKVNGMRVYLGTRMTKQDEDDDDNDQEDLDNAGKMVFIFSPTILKGQKNVDLGNDNYWYYREKSGKFKKTNCRKTVKRWVRNYQNPNRFSKKRAQLKQTTYNNENETKHIWFNKDKIESMKCDLECTLQKNKLGINIELISYTDKKTEDSLLNQNPYFKRLSIEFHYITKNTEPYQLSLNQLNLKKYFRLWAQSKPEEKTKLKNELVELMKKNNIISSTTFLSNKINWEQLPQTTYKAMIQVVVHDTGDPTPPPPGGNQEDLDYDAL